MSNGTPFGMVTKAILGNMKKGSADASQRMGELGSSFSPPSINDLASQSNFGQQPIPPAPVNPADPQNTESIIQRLRSGLGREGRQEALGGLLDMFK